MLIRLSESGLITCWGLIKYSMYCKILRGLDYMNYQQEYSISKVMSYREMKDRTGGSLTFSAEQLHPAQRWYSPRSQWDIWVLDGFILLWKMSERIKTWGCCNGCDLLTNLWLLWLFVFNFLIVILIVVGNEQLFCMARTYLFLRAKVSGMKA